MSRRSPRAKSPPDLHPASSKTSKRSRRLDTGVSRKPVTSDLFNSGVSNIHHSTSLWRTTITTTSKAWSAVPPRLKATPVSTTVGFLTTRSTSGRLTLTTRLSRLPHTPPGRRLMSPMVRMGHVLFPLLTLTSLILLPPKAKPLQVTLSVAVVTLKHNSLGLRRLFRWRKWLRSGFLLGHRRGRVWWDWLLKPHMFLWGGSTRLRGFKRRGERLLTRA